MIGVPLGTSRTCSPTADWPGHIFHQYMIRVRGEGARERLHEHLTAAGIQTEVYYPRPLHLQECFPESNHVRLPVAERIATEVLALPVHPQLDDDQLRLVADTISDFFLSRMGKRRPRMKA